MKKVEKSIELGGRKLTLQTGVLAQQATGAVLASYGETVVLATVVSTPPKQDLGYFPLFVEYQERLYAGGRIKGSRWVKREGRPTDNEILSGRLIDRSIRPLFPHNYKKDVQVMITVLSVDIENDPTILGAIATSAALAISSIPWKGPVATLRVGKKDGTYFVNPVGSEMQFSDMDLIVSGTADSVLMIEAGAKEVSEEEILGGVEFAQKEAKKVLELINDLSKEIGLEKEVLPKEVKVEELKSRIKKEVDDKLIDLISNMAAHEGGLSYYAEIQNALVAKFSEKDPATIASIFEKIVKAKVREMTLAGKRADGRKLDQIREISSQVGVLPRTHGSAIFTRGQTQVLTVTTLGAPSLGQLIESAEGEESKHYMHHYSMPPYATGETGRIGSPNRREIGHGALAERALEPVIPSNDKFPYTIRVVSEVMSSNGSTSMASVCGSTLSLMDAGVPITAPVSGVAMGLVVEDKGKYAILSDIIGMEDYLVGDMDFKVAGTEKGICALQLDVKTLNLTTSILKEALAQAKEGRAFILKEMLKTLAIPHEKVSVFAPKIKVVKVPVGKIGEVIGPGGRMIKKIIADTGAQVEVEDDGTVNVSGTSSDAVDAAIATIEGLIKEVVAGEIYDGVVKRIQPFGAFVEILPGKDGLVHVSDMAEGFVKDPNDIVKIGDAVKVRVKEVDNLGRINLSMRMDASKDKPREERRGSFGERRPHFSQSGRDSGGEGGFSGRRTGARGFGGRRPGSGPHFPTSRFLDRGKKDFGR
ncbi:polyribonucleotide nucleotidyltransferase [Candidatus Woesebacteria bacterium RIFOXYA1_FULL_40_18]|uniref:Polyribonucleotide nucleotidyltransferase n=4 Tax=Candidatus Woeseibacteriota TaxID=1752722 RepID=A0A1F8CLB8_9BACT|nr:MAG: Polyribonucleotide nucleotidyltransferase [Candidatus Woesebacteria bacterium GW2011_GWB1_40_101]OGM77042.1 MAG: polyribonucleotide nucleotidyltransferase [Candidatus Woesebacteria bacterium RIFOXYA1_FULL_40_18]OGM81705.1 MAG: polyribonucleotide nucleotidyltransferase [Candidatus Woesebacteria bacterium RIFOXYB1_FULL_40_26]OGM88726.1 MAG: polyribonucleotide nucleotidyltransferase [Candidatus Woesebacteria bacterium RIFOXYD1_FULL_40_21]